MTDSANGVWPLVVLNTVIPVLFAVTGSLATVCPKASSVSTRLRRWALTIPPLWDGYGSSPWTSSGLLGPPR